MTSIFTNVLPQTQFSLEYLHRSHIQGQHRRLRLIKRRQQSIPSNEYRVIGFGQCGLVFERPGQGHALKIARRTYEDSLWNDFRAHCRVQKAFESSPIECRIPKVFSYVPKDNTEWWDRNIALFPSVHESVNLPAMTLISEEILPLPRIARQALIEKYCLEESRASVAENPTNRDCLARCIWVVVAPIQCLLSISRCAFSTST